MDWGIIENATEILFVVMCGVLYQVMYSKILMVGQRPYHIKVSVLGWLVDSRYIL